MRADLVWKSKLQSYQIGLLLVVAVLFVLCSGVRLVVELTLSGFFQPATAGFAIVLGFPLGVVLVISAYVCVPWAIVWSVWLLAKKCLNCDGAKFTSPVILALVLFFFFTLYVVYLLFSVKE